MLVAMQWRPLPLFSGALVAAVAQAATLEPLTWEAAEAKADATLAQMTAQELHSLMQGVGWRESKEYLGLGSAEAGYYMGNTPPIPRLGVPALKMHDAGNGFRPNWMPDWNASYHGLGSTTCWPSALALASSWDEALVQRVSAAIAREFRSKGANVILGPGVQVHRVARNGRNFEYLSGEDPYLGSRLAAAYVRGVQGEGIMACAKHWAFNEQETYRIGGNSEVDERTAWELYYPPFEAAVDAGVGSIMCGYNRVNGTFACENEALLLRALKKRMGFRGFVMSDWWATHSTAVEQGLDQEMPGAAALGGILRFGPFFTHEELEFAEKPETRPLVSALRHRIGGWWLRLLGAQSFLAPVLAGDKPREAVFQEPVRRILAALYRTRLDEQPGCTPGSRECMGQLLVNTSGEHLELSREAAARSVVLLKNEGVLPIRLDRVRRVALLGNALDAEAAYVGPSMPPPDFYSGGGSGHVGASGLLTKPLRELVRRAAAANVEPLLPACVLSRPCGLDEIAEEAVTLARQADLLIFVGATTATEGADRENLHLEPHIFLNNSVTHSFTDNIIEAVAAHCPTVVLMQVPGTILMPWRDKVAAIACLFLGGDQTGFAWAATVFGDVNPSGKLPIMLPKTEQQTISPGKGKHVKYSEGLFTSYRSPTAAEDSAFPFGHGLSYTSFKYASPVELREASRCSEATSLGVLAPRDIVACVQVLVMNVGERAGSEVAQAYLEFPAEALEPKLLLRGFQRTGELGPGEGKAVLFGITRRDLSVYQAGAWRLQGRATLHVGASSADLRGSLPLRLGTGSGGAAPRDGPAQDANSEL